MKYLILSALVAAGCLFWLVSRSDLGGLTFSSGQNTESEISSLETSVSAINDGEYDLGGASGSAPELVLMKFGAPWCGPCRMIDKELHKLERSGLPVEIRKFNVDDRPVLARRYEVRSIPRLVLLQNGQKIGDLVGYRSAEELTDWIEDSASKQALAAKKQPTGPSVVRANPYFE